MATQDTTPPGSGASKIAKQLLPEMGNVGHPGDGWCTKQEIRDAMAAQGVDIKDSQLRKMLREKVEAGSMERIKDVLFDGVRQDFYRWKG